MAILTQRRETGRWQRIRGAIDNGSYGHPWQTGFVCRFDNPKRFHIHRTGPALLPQVGFRSGIGNDMMASDQFALLRWKLFGNGSRTELVDEVTTCHRPLTDPILAHHLCANDDGASGKPRGETSREAKAHETLRRKATDQHTSGGGGPCMPDASLHDYMLRCRRAVDRIGVCSQALSLTKAEEARGDLTRQGNDHANAAHPALPPISAER